MTMLHHVSLGVAELARAAAFYDAALGALGFRRVFEDGKHYYAAFIVDPDGHHIEAVVNTPA